MEDWMPQLVEGAKEEEAKEEKGPPLTNTKSSQYFSLHCMQA